MIRVAEVIECTIGGTRRHIRELCGGLAERGFAVTLFASAERDRTFERDLEDLARRGVEVVPIPMVREVAPLTDHRHERRLRREFSARDFDVIHTHSSKAGALGRIAAKRAGSRAALVHTPHTFAFTFTEQFGPLKRRLFLAIERWLGKRTARMVHVSESERAEAARFRVVPPERAVVIPNGIDADDYARSDGARARAGLRLAPDALLVGTIGLLNEAKGHAHLIDAAAAVKKVRPGVTFVVAGEGPLRPALEQRIAAHGLESSFQLLGFRNDVPELLAAFDLFVLPSLWEGLPYVLLEAMAAGKASVVSDVNGCRDLVEHDRTGLIVKPADPTALANAIDSLLADRERRDRFGAAAAAHVRAEYSLERMLERYAILYRDAAASR